MKINAPSGPSTEIQILTSQELICSNHQDDHDEENPLTDSVSEPHVKFSDVKVYDSEHDQEADADLEDNREDTEKYEENTNENFNNVVVSEHKEEEEESRATEGTSLLNEVSKYLNSRVTFDSNEQTSL